MISSMRVCSICVLIETLWNVKEIRLLIVARAVSVLIETLWNVKTGYYLYFDGSALSFNRNIVECKAH